MVLDKLTPALPLAVLVLSLTSFWMVEAWQRLPVLAFAGRKPRNLFVIALDFILTGLGATLVVLAARHAAGAGWGLVGLADLPPAARIVIGVFAIDLVDYWRHRLSHEIGLLWRLHRLHHSDPEVDVTTSFRNHPVETIMRSLIFATAALILGIPAESFVAFSLLWLAVQVFQHARIRLPEGLDRAMRVLVVTPRWHRVHHSRRQEQTDSHYGTLFTIGDRLFRTATPTRSPEAIGLAEFSRPYDRTLRGMLLNPVLEVGQHGGG